MRVKESMSSTISVILDLKAYSAFILQQSNGEKSWRALARTLPTECPKHPNVTFGMNEKASLQQGKLLQQRNVPCGALAKDSNTSRFRDQPFKTAATKSARMLPTECLKQLVSSRKNLGEHLPERYLRNARKS